MRNNFKDGAKAKIVQISVRYDETGRQTDELVILENGKSMSLTWMRETINL